MATKPSTFIIKTVRGVRRQILQYDADVFNEKIRLSASLIIKDIKELGLYDIPFDSPDIKGEWAYNFDSSKRHWIDTTLTWTPNDNDFTLTYLSNPTKTSGNDIMFASGGNGIINWWCGLNGGRVTFTVGTKTNTGTVYLYTGTKTYYNKGWQHFAVVRKNNNLTFYVDGVVDSSIPFTYNLENPTNSLLRLGSFSGSGSYYQGGLRNLRIFNKGFNQDDILEDKNTKQYSKNTTYLVEEFTMNQEKGLEIFGTKGTVAIAKSFYSIIPKPWLVITPPLVTHYNTTHEALAPVLTTETLTDGNTFYHSNHTQDLDDITITIYPKPQTTLIKGNKKVEKNSQYTYYIDNDYGSEDFVYNWDIDGASFQGSNLGVKEVTINFGGEDGKVILTCKITNGAGCFRVIKKNIYIGLIHKDLLVIRNTYL
jgi:hypothetical protein